MLKMHGVIHRQHLIERHLNDRIHKPMCIVIRAVYKLKRISLSSRLCRWLCKSDEEFDSLLFTFWGEMVMEWQGVEAIIFTFQLCHTIFSWKNIYHQLSKYILVCKRYIPYFTNLFNILNDAILQLHSSDVHIIKPNFTNVLSWTRFETVEKCWTPGAKPISKSCLTRK